MDISLGSYSKRLDKPEKTRTTWHRDIGSHSKLEDFGVPCQVQLEPLGMWTCCPRPCCPRLLRMQMLSLRPDIFQQDTPSSCRFLRAEIDIISINFSFKIVRNSMGKHLHILQCSILQHDYARPLQFCQSADVSPCCENYHVSPTVFDELVMTAKRMTSAINFL